MQELKEAQQELADLKDDDDDENMYPGLQKGSQEGAQSDVDPS